MKNSNKRRRSLCNRNQEPEIKTARSPISQMDNNNRLIYKQNSEIIKKWSSKNRATSNLNTSRGSVFSPLSHYLESIDEHSDSSYNSLSGGEIDECNLTQRQKKSLFFRGSVLKQTL